MSVEKNDSMLDRLYTIDIKKKQYYRFIWYKQEK